MWITQGLIYPNRRHRRSIVRVVVTKDVSRLFTGDGEPSGAGGEVNGQVTQGSIFNQNRVARAADTIHTADGGADHCGGWIAIRYRERIAKIACAVGLQLAISINVFAAIQRGLEAPELLLGLTKSS